MKKLILLGLILFLPFCLFAASNYDEIFSPLMNIQNILKYLGGIVLVISLIAQGVIMFFGDNIPEMVKKTIGKVATGGCFIGGASAIGGFILPASSIAMLA